MGNDLFLLLFTMYYLVYSPPTPGLCPPDMAYLPAGELIVGSNLPNQRPFRRLKNDAYCVDVHEYPGMVGEMPQGDVNWQEAERLCELTGKRLCTEIEWEKACRGSKRTRFSYGKHYNEISCGDNMRKTGRTFPLGFFPGCRSDYGVFDMNGGLAEWTASPYAPYAKGEPWEFSPTGYREKSVRSLPFEESYCSNRLGIIWSERDGTIGFRCCLSFSAAENKRVRESVWRTIGRY